MKHADAIRLNITIHPEKDPELFNYVMAISNVQARPRRLLNLALRGLFIDQSNIAKMVENAVIPVKKKSDKKKKKTKNLSKD